MGWLYGLLIVTWLTLYTSYGDELWWLALVNALAPLLFLPLIPLLGFALVWQRPLFLAPLMPIPAIFLFLYGEQFPLDRMVNGWLDQPQVTVMSFNVWGGSRAPETAAILIDNGLPDIVALQELTPHMVTVLDEVVGREYPFRALVVDEGLLGVGILSRFPLIELDASHLFDLGWKVQIAEVETPEQPLVVYNLHASATNLFHYWHAGSSLAAEVQASYQQRRTFAERLRADIGSRTLPVVVAGDFNSTERSDVYKILTQELVDAHRAGGWGFGHTFPVFSDSYREVPALARLFGEKGAPRPSQHSPLYQLASLRLLRIDMIFHSRELTTTRSWVSATHGESDHLPVLATLRWVE
jgi:endonuclease/exonuclease/phosphatase (EEP) superfamily protein YafD